MPGPPAERGGAGGCSEESEDLLCGRRKETEVVSASRNRQLISISYTTGVRFRESMLPALEFTPPTTNRAGARRQFLRKQRSYPS